MVNYSHIPHVLYYHSCSNKTWPHAGNKNVFLMSYTIIVIINKTWSHVFETGIHSPCFTMPSSEVRHAMAYGLKYEHRTLKCMQKYLGQEVYSAPYMKRRKVQFCYHFMLHIDVSNLSNRNLRNMGRTSDHIHRSKLYASYALNEDTRFAKVLIDMKIT